MSVAGTVVFHGLGPVADDSDSTKRRPAEHAGSAISDMNKSSAASEDLKDASDSLDKLEIDPALLMNSRTITTTFPSTHNPEGKITLARIEKLKKQGENGIEFAKRGFFNKAWKKRWFVCIEQNLMYFENKTRWDRHASPKGIIHLAGCVVKPIESTESDGHGAHFPLTIEQHGAKKRHYYLDAPTSKDRQEWMEIIELASMDQSQFSYKRAPGGANSAYTASSYASLSTSQVSHASHEDSHASFSISKNSESTNSVYAGGGVGDGFVSSPNTPSASSATSSFARVMAPAVPSASAGGTASSGSSSSTRSSSPGRSTRSASPARRDK